MPAHVRGYLFNATYSLTHPLFDNHHIAYCWLLWFWLGWTNTTHDRTLDQILQYYWTWKCAFCCNFIIVGFVRNLECRYYRASDLPSADLKRVWRAITALPRGVFILLRGCWIRLLYSHGISQFTRVFELNPLLSCKHASISWITDHLVWITKACGVFSGDYFYSNLLSIVSDYTSAVLDCNYISAESTANNVTSWSICSTV